MTVSKKKKADFQKTVWDFYHQNKREELPWRKNISAYRVWISEIMLQQTQVDRVILFFNNWMKQFPNIKKLADTPQSGLLRAWKGLGYNSRALRIKKTAEIIIKDYKGIFPKKYSEILKLSGIGPYTAGAICAFVSNEPVSIIETNIRRVYLHHFYSTEKNTHDQELMVLITETMDIENPREWYWALMDYGSYLGKTIPNPNKKSRHYVVQKKFKGSDREIRGKVLEILLEFKKISLETLNKKIQQVSNDRERIERIVALMETEGFLEIKNGKVFLKK